MRDDLHPEAVALRDAMRENGFANHETVAKLMSDYIQTGGLAPSQARTLALRYTRTSGTTYESLAEQAGISRGAFDKTSSDAKRNLREARGLARLTRDDYPVGLVGTFDLSMGPEPYVDSEYDHFLIGEYLPVGPDGEDVGLRYVVYRESYASAGEQHFPDTDTRHLFAGTSVERYEDADALVDDLYYDADFHDANHDWEMYWNLRDCGFDFASNVYASLSVGDEVRFTSDPEGDAFLGRLKDEVAEVTDLAGDERVRVRFAVTDPETGEDAEVMAMAHDLDQS